MNIRRIHIVNIAMLLCSSILFATGLYLLSGLLIGFVIHNMLALADKYGEQYKGIKKEDKIVIEGNKSIVYCDLEIDKIVYLHDNKIHHNFKDEIEVEKFLNRFDGIVDDIKNSNFEGYEILTEKEISNILENFTN